MKTVFLTGTFDLIHEQHIAIIKFAKLQGDYLVIALDSDERVKKLKGNDRPIYSQWERKYILEEMRSVDEVHVFNSDDELITLLKAFRPEIRIIGGDYMYGKKIIGRELSKELIIFQRLKSVSTSDTIQRIKNG